MNQRIILRPALWATAVAATLFGLAAFVSAQTVNVTFPIPELGNCTSKQECHAYCDQPANKQACINFAQKHGLITQQQAEQEQKFVQTVQQGGPGGCNTQEACAAYCDQLDHAQECLQFATQHQLVSQNDQQDISQFQQALQSGIPLPGGCKTLGECESYCTQDAHVDECVAFGEKSGLIPKDKLGDMKKMVTLMDSGQTPGGCKSKQACQTYCQDTSHSSECIAFGQKMGFINQQQAQAMQSTGGKGPGGCDSEQACQTFCNQPENRQACFAFAKNHDLIPPDQLKQIQQNTQQFQNQFNNMPASVKDCLTQSLGADKLAQIASGQFMPGPEMNDAMQQCFQQDQHSQDQQMNGKQNPFGQFSNQPCQQGQNSTSTDQQQPCNPGQGPEGQNYNGSGTPPNMMPPGQGQDNGYNPCVPNQPCNPGLNSGQPCENDQPCSPNNQNFGQQPQPCSDNQPCQPNNQNFGNQSPCVPNQPCNFGPTGNATGSPSQQMNCAPNQPCGPDVQNFGSQPQPGTPCVPNQPCNQGSNNNQPCVPNQPCNYGPSGQIPPQGYNTAPPEGSMPPNGYTPPPPPPSNTTAPQ